MKALIILVLLALAAEKAERSSTASARASAEIINAATVSTDGGVQAPADVRFDRDPESGIVHFEGRAP